MIGASWLVDDLLRVEDILIETASASDHSLVRDPALHLIKAGGKRLRPALVLICARSGEARRRETDLAAASVELVHLATLYHDDVIDETEIRRGVQTIVARWGIEIAVLVGDYLFARACTLAADAGGEVPGILARAIARVCEGQVAETAVVGRSDRSVDDYIETIEKKTASLFAASCKLGAVTAGAAEATISSLERYGGHLGVAFQMVDDVLDLVGSPDVIGKQPGTDIKEGVFTMPILIACERDQAIAEKIKNDRDLAWVLDALRETGALEETLDRARAQSDAARMALADLEASEWRSTLGKVVEGVLAQVPVEVA